MYILVAAVAAFLFAYSYFINASVLFVVERKAAENESAVLLSRISGLETDYFNISENISVSLANSMGFKEVKEVSFIGRKSIVMRSAALDNR